MRTAATVRRVVFSAVMGLLPLAGARGDEGMWLLTRPPTEALRADHGFAPTAGWLEHLQKSAVRFSTGGSASLVSDEGLVMTNHHVGSDMLAKLSTPEKNLLKSGFYAGTREGELQCPDLELNILWEIEDVTDRVMGAAGVGASDAEANTARRKMMTTIEDESQKKTGLLSQIVTLYQGGKYHLYRYKRFTDVRLVFAPEEEIAFFGGDTDNFEFPRYDLDCCFFRIYEEGKPFRPEHFLKWSKGGAAEGELAFVFGHPGRTRRLYTVDHLKFLRDVEVPATLARYWRREVQLQSFMARSGENARIGRDDYFGIQNSRKAVTGQLAGLQDPRLMAKKQEAESKLRGLVKGEGAGAWDKAAAAERAYRGFFERRLAFDRGLGNSELFGIARHLVRLAEEKPKATADRLREYRESELENVYLELYSPAPIYEDLEIDRLASGLANMAERLGGDDPAVVKALGGKGPRDRAVELVRGTGLKDIARRRALGEGGKAAVAASGDPMIALAAALDPEARRLRSKYEDEIEGAERDAYAKIAAAKFAAEGEKVYPDATFTLRMAYGTVKGYTEGGKKVPAFTTFAGLYERAKERAGQEGFTLPASWIAKKDALDLSTPFNFVLTADIIGGNSGSPVVNKAGELVGLIFDGNIQSLTADFVYDDAVARALAVDSRGLIEALRKVYGARALAEELTR